MKVIAHIDMDCFFCACEIKRNPELAGKSVIVGSTGKRGVVSTSSYEARKLGVFSATPISKARRSVRKGYFCLRTGNYILKNQGISWSYSTE